MKLPTKDEMRARFWELKGKIDAAEARTAPLREARDASWNAAQAADRAAMAEIRAVEADVAEGLSMFDAKMELAFIARGLGGTVGEPV